MKKLFACLLALALYLPLAAFAEIDLSGMTYNELLSLRSEIDRALSNFDTASSSVVSTATRRVPAHIGQTVELHVTEDPGFDFVIRITVNDFFRGDSFSSLMIDRYNPAPRDGYEFVAVKVTVEFIDVTNIDIALTGTDDPELLLNAISSFDLYNSNGAKYDSVRYSISDLPELNSMFEGGISTGYFRFEVLADDPAPYLVYTPVYLGDHSAWISLD